MKIIIQRNSNLIIYLIVGALIMLSFFVRLNNFSYPYNHDSNRDYLVARHIIDYKEFPINGPNGVLLNSPVYYYFMAFLIMINRFFKLFNNDFLFLNIINILFQVGGILVIFLLAQKLFSRTTALIALILFGFSDAILVHSENIWQPYSMEPFANLSYLLLAVAYFKKNYLLIALSAVFFIFAGILHNSVFALAPAFIVILYLIYKKHELSLKFYITTLFIILVCLLLFYLPLFLHPKTLSQELPVRLSSHGFIFSPLSQPIMLFSNFFDRMETLVNIFFKIIKTGWALLIICFLTIAYFALEKSRNRSYVFALGLIIIQYLIITACLKMGWTSFPVRYFTPILGLFVILLAEMTNRVFSGYFLLRLAKMLAVISLLYVFSSAHFFSMNKPLSVKTLGSLEEDFLKMSKNHAIINTIEEEILDIKGRNNFKEFNFFSLQSYINGRECLDAAFWVAMERDFKTRLVKVDDHDLCGYKPITNDEFIFLICATQKTQKDEDNTCYTEFTSANKNYKIIKTVVSHPTFTSFLAEKVRIIE